MILNIGDKKTKLLLSLAKSPLLFYPHYKYHLPLPSPRHAIKKTRLHGLWTIRENH